MALTDIGSGVLYGPSTTGSGTGNYDSFLRLGANNSETGFNTDVLHQDDNKDGIWTHSLQVGSLDTTIVNGVEYYEIRLDLNEIQSGDSPNITLEDLQLFSSAAPAVNDSFAGMNQVFDLGSALNLVDTNHGSGTDDYVFYIPVSLFPDPSQYFTLYAEFSGSDDGFEEFRALSSVFTPQPDIGVTKETNGTNGECNNILVGSTVTWTYTVENNGNVPLSNVVVKDDAGTPGNTADDFNATYVSGDANTNGLLDTNETWIFTATGTATAGEYANTATVSGAYVSGGVTTTVTGTEGDCYYGATPDIAIVKQTDNTDGKCLNLIVGSPVTWTYDVTNSGELGIDGATLTVIDDAGTPGTGTDALDDITPDAILDGSGHNTGDINQNDVLDPGETWHYTASGTVTAGEYTNTATVNGTAFDEFQNTAPVTANESDCYNGSTPSIDIVKETNGTDDLCPVLMVGDAVTWTYDVTNNSAFGITDVVVTDDNGDGPGANDFNPDAVLDGSGHNTGDINQNDVLDPNETWHYTASGIVAEGHYENVATVTGTATDENGYTAPVTNNESDCYLGLEGPCPRTPGFWAHWTDFWNGTSSVPSQAGQDDFPTADLLYAVDSNHNGSIGAGDVPGLLIGDYNHNGLTDNYGPDGIPGTSDDFQEDTLFVSYPNAINLINASTKQMNDGVVKIGRDVVATWLNYLMGSPVGDASDTNSPAHFINAAVNYLQTFGDSSSSNTYNSSEIFDTYAANHAAVKTSSAYWNNNIVGNSGAQIHSALDGYNNTGTINGIVYAPDCDNQQFLSNFHAYALDGALFAA
jgi:hypothetical protein